MDLFFSNFIVIANAITFFQLVLLQLLRTAILYYPALVVQSWSSMQSGWTPLKDLLVGREAK